MREISLVKKLKFNFNGSVTKRALVLGDADNDGNNELVCANLQGDLAIFKECRSDKFAYASDLGMITACIVGDVINLGRNFVVAINMEGWLFIFDATHNQVCGSKVSGTNKDNNEANLTDENQSSDNYCSLGKKLIEQPKIMDIFYQQRMPANCRELLVADLDGDGQNELIVGLTDRVLRTYKWIDIGQGRCKFVGLYKWEFADQIGSVSLNPSRRENCLDIIVAQPGGTYARLECFDKKTPFASHLSPNKSAGSAQTGEHTQQKEFKFHNQQENQDIDAVHDNVKTEYISKLTPEYHQLALGQMRNHHVSTEVSGGLKNGRNSETHSSLVIATLDGTLMLVDKDQILWSLQVDHQLFALAVIERNTRHQRSQIRSSSLPQSESTCTIVPTSDFSDQPIAGTSCSISRSERESYLSDIDEGRQYLTVCAWNGKTYIIDEDRNYLRFKFEESVSAFTAGTYYFDGIHHSALVYATFNNQIILYYDVVAEDIKPTFLLDEIYNNPQLEDLREKLRLLSGKLDCDISSDQSLFDESNKEILYNLLQDILYGFSDHELTKQ